MNKMEKEIWKDVVGYEGLYQISSEGRVKRLARIGVDSMGRHMPYREKILVNYISKSTGYPCINLSKNRKVLTWNIHTLIADAFIPNPDNLPCVNHKDENRANSVLSNLERCTYSYNNSYGTAREKRRTAQKEFYIRNNKEMKTLQNDIILSVIQYTINGEMVGFFKGGFPEIKEKLGYGSSVSSCLCHKNKTAYGFVWRYVGDEFSYTPPKTVKGNKYPNCKPKSHQKYVIKIDNEGNELERYKSVSAAGDANGFDRHLFSRTTPVDGIITIRGMRFIVEKKENEYIPVGHKGARPDLIGKCGKPVCQYTKDGKFIAEYSSLKEAATTIGNARFAPEISNCCQMKLKTARGYIWRYKGDAAPKPFENESIRSITQYTIYGDFVCTYPSITDAIKALGYGTPTCIGNNLAGRSHSAYGFVWKYSNT